MLPHPPLEIQCLVKKVGIRLRKTWISRTTIGRSQSQGLRIDLSGSRWKGTLFLATGFGSGYVRSVDGLLKGVLKRKTVRAFRISSIKLFSSSRISETVPLCTT